MIDNMSNYGLYTGDKEKSCSYKWGEHWAGKGGYKLVQGNSIYNHYFGGETWKLPVCKNCGKHYHQIITLDMSDNRVNIKYKGAELPLVSCLNCSLMWEPQLFKIDYNNKEVHILSDDNKYKWIADEEFRIPVPLTPKRMKLVDLDKEDNPLTETMYYNSYEKFGNSYLARVLGAPLYAQNPIDYECPICHQKMDYIASICATDSNDIFDSYDFVIGDFVIYFLYCENCCVIKTEGQGD